MTEQYKDAYQSKYREETVQIHAPLSLIEKTKAAVREEEKRLAATQGAMAASAGALVMQEKRLANREPQIRVFSVRKWAYPLTAAAALLILVSVSLTMRGLKSGNKLDASSPAFDGAAESGAVYEAAAADEGYEEMAAEAPAEEAAAAAPAADMAESEADGFFETQDAGGAVSAGAGQTDGLSNRNAVAEMAAPMEERLAEDSVEKPASEPADETLQKKAANAQKQEAESERRGLADTEDFSIEKVEKRPARFSGSDVEIRRHEGKNFRILETASGENEAKKTWEAYVEGSAGGRYVICGQAENVDDFLAAAYRKLEEAGE